MSIFKTAHSAATRRLGWPGSRPRRPSLLGWPGVAGRAPSDVESSEEEVVSRETDRGSAEVVSRGTREDPDDEPPTGDSRLVGDALADDTSAEPVPAEPSPTDQGTTPMRVGRSADAVVVVPGDDHLDEPTEGSSKEDDPAGATSREASSTSSDSIGEALGLESDRDQSASGEAATNVAVTSTVTLSAAAAPASTVTMRARGPRRAKFDRDEFDNSPTPDEPSARPAAQDQSSTGFPAPTQTRIFVVANQKGGVGKTTTSVNLAAALALGGLNVLVLDLDPQGNASTALGIDHGPGVPGTYEVLIEGAAIEDHLVSSPEAPHLQVLPATIDLAGAEIQLVSSVARENRLRKALRTYLADHPVDYVFLDCPPSLGLITLNALVAASEILIPIQCEYYALEGVSQLVRTINLVKGELNEGLEVSTVLLTMYDARTRLAAQVAEEVRSYFTEQTLPTVIPRSVRISEAPSYGQTVLTYHPDSAGAVSYLEAAQEIARRGARQEGQ